MNEGGSEQVDDGDWKSSLRRPPRGKVLVQMPMRSFLYREWREAVDERLAKEADEWAARDRLSGSRGLTRHAALARLSMVFPDADQFLGEALFDHINHYGYVASNEAGFDLGIEAHDMLVGKPDGHVIVFATIDPEACKRLSAREGVSLALERMEQARVARSGEECTDESEKLMNLLATALPQSDRSLGHADPRYVIDCGVKGRLAVQQFYEQTFSNVAGSRRN
ncbi:MAG: hypothetical protein CFE29_01815 [Bradyrhizobiaceae bacterium PARB1]|jgi:hypothetical protein|nr:MAG: hypothetical protein CFE29_01815 [Bradyrhizobiaceae bacterium PARB1]